MTLASPQLPATLELAGRIVAACERGVQFLTAERVTESHLKRAMDLMFSTASAVVPFAAAPHFKAAALAIVAAALSAVAAVNRRFDTWQASLPSMIALVRCCAPRPRRRLARLLFDDRVLMQRWHSVAAILTVLRAGAGARAGAALV